MISGYVQTYYTAVIFYNIVHNTMIIVIIFIIITTTVVIKIITSELLIMSTFYLLMKLVIVLHPHSPHISLFFSYQSSTRTFLLDENVLWGYHSSRTYCILLQHLCLWQIRWHVQQWNIVRYDANMVFFVMHRVVFSALVLLWFGQPHPIVQSWQKQHVTSNDI